MRRKALRLFHVMVHVPDGPDRRFAVTKRLVAALAFILLITEAAVAIRFSGSTGLVLMVSTAGLGAFAYRGLSSLSPSARQADAESATGEGASAFAHRAQLIDTLSRDIARSERYSHSLTLAIVRISQYEEMKSSWGTGTARLAAAHVIDTLGRITRASDYVARIDEATFGVVLLQCSGRQAELYSDRLALAVSNRPLKSTSRVKVPLYVGVEINAVEYDSTRFRGPLDFLSVAGGDVAPERRRAPHAIPQTNTATDPRVLREQLVKDYYPEGEMKDFAEAYKEARTRNRHAG